MSYDKLDIPKVHAYLVDNLGINLRNLKVHRDFLQDNKVLVQKHLDMEQFGRLGGNFSGYSTRREIQAVREAGLNPDCGSTMCIVGWAVANPGLKPELDAVEALKFFGWEEVSNLFVGRVGDAVGLFDYLFGPTWDDDLGLALDRMYLVIDAVETVSEASIKFLCAAANTSNMYSATDRSHADLEYPLEYTTTQWVQSVAEDRYVMDLEYLTPQ